MTNLCVTMLAGQHSKPLQASKDVLNAFSLMYHASLCLFFFFFHFDPRSFFPVSFQFTDKEDGLETKQQCFPANDRYQAASGQISEAGSRRLLSNHNLLHAGWVRHHQVILGGEEKTQVGRDAINPNNSSASPGTHTVHIPLLAIIQHTLHNSNNLWLCEIDFWGALPHKTPTQLFDAGPAEGTGTRWAGTPARSTHFMILPGTLLKKEGSDEFSTTRWLCNSLLQAKQRTESTRHLKNTKSWREQCCCPRLFQLLNLSG